MSKGNKKNARTKAKNQERKKNEDKRSKAAGLSPSSSRKRGKP